MVWSFCTSPLRRLKMIKFPSRGYCGFGVKSNYKYNLVNRKQKMILIPQYLILFLLSWKRKEKPKIQPHWPIFSKLLIRKFLLKGHVQLNLPSLHIYDLKSIFSHYQAYSTDVGCSEVDRVGLYMLWFLRGEEVLRFTGVFDSRGIWENRCARSKGNSFC